MCFVNVHFRAHHENYVGRLVVSTFLFTRKTVCYVSLLNVIAKAAVVLWWWVWDWTDADREFVVVEPATWVTSEELNNAMRAKAAWCCETVCWYVVKSHDILSHTCQILPYLRAIMQMFEQQFDVRLQLLERTSALVPHLKMFISRTTSLSPEAHYGVIAHICENQPRVWPVGKEEERSNIQVRQQDAHLTNAGSAVKTMCNTIVPPPFQGPTFSSLIVCLYLVDSKLLELTSVERRMHML